MKEGYIIPKSTEARNYRIALCNTGPALFCDCGRCAATLPQLPIDVFGCRGGERICPHCDQLLNWKAPTPLLNLLKLAETADPFPASGDKSSGEESPQRVIANAAELAPADARELREGRIKALPNVIDNYLSDVIDECDTYREGSRSHYVFSSLICLLRMAGDTADDAALIVQTGRDRNGD